VKNQKLAIIGRGISGLSCGIELLKKGHSVDIYSKDALSQTTSMSAGAFWWPYNTKPLDKVKVWSAISYQAYKTFEADPLSGVSFQTCLRFCEQEDDTQSLLEMVEVWSAINGLDYGIPCEKAYRIVLPVIDVPTFMPYVEEQYRALSGQIFIQTIRTIEELFENYDIVINCCGLGAYQLVHDTSVYPIRGQVLSIAKEDTFSSDVRIILAKDYFTMILPRAHDYLLGGTADIGDWSLEVNPMQSNEFKKRCEQVMPELKNTHILHTSVGLRPGRDEIRLELERYPNGKSVIHNYGHGGGGYTVAWGCAQEVLSLLESL
jgi:D-amino-acid oxidase